MGTVPNWKKLRTSADAGSTVTRGLQFDFVRLRAPAFFSYARQDAIPPAGLAYLRDERGLRYGAKNGPRHFSWFPTVVGDYFQKRREGQLPPSATDVEFSQEQFDSMTDAIEI